MATAGTLLTDLESKPPVFSNKDDDLVNKILADMNIPSTNNPIVNKPNSGNTNRVLYSPNPNSTYPMATDATTANSHLIGKEYPSSADFANLMHSQSYPSHTYENQSQSPPPTLIESTKSMYTDLFISFKQPILVAIIIFLVNLPILNVLIGYYIPSLLRMGGDLTSAGLVLKSMFGGFLFWFIQKVIVPLMVL